MDSSNGCLRVSDVREMEEVGKQKAIQIIQHLGGNKDALGQWQLDESLFYAWQNNPLRRIELKKGRVPVNIDDLVCWIREYSGGRQVTISVSKKKGTPNYYIRLFSDCKPDVRRSLRTSDKNEARDIESEIRSRLRQSELTGIIHISTETFLNEWLDSYDHHPMKTWQRFKAVRDKIQPFLPHEIHMTQPRDIERFKDSLKRKGYADNSILLELNTIKRLFKYAQTHGYIEKNPVEGIKKPKKVKSKVEPYTDDEIDRIFKELDHRCLAGFREQSVEAWQIYREVIYMLYYLGVRISDALSMQIDYFSNNFGVVEFKQKKTSKKVKARVPSELQNRLRNFLQDREEQTGYLFLNTAGHPLLQHHVYNAMRTVLDELGIKKKSALHAYRHTTAIKMLEAGIPIHEVANQLGDTVETIVRNYVAPTMPSQESIDLAF